MALALYAEGVGYYQNHVPGQDSVYETSPTMTPVFGRLICRALERMWEALGEPSTFEVVEVGGGSGALAAAAIGASEGAFAQAITWIFIEPFGGIAAAQSRRLAELKGKIRWEARLEDIEGVRGCILANEVLDNFPVRLFECQPDGPHEEWVRFGSGFEEKLESGGAPERAMAAWKVLDLGDRFEICEHIDDWCARASRTLASGYLLVIDYGDYEPDHWLRQPSGSVVTYGGGMLGTDPLIDVGERDITAHVNFTHLLEASTSRGFDALASMTQRELLDRLGIADVIADLRTSQREAEVQGDHVTSLSLLAQRSKLGALTAAGGLGDLRVFLASKDARAPNF